MSVLGDTMCARNSRNAHGTRKTFVCMRVCLVCVCVCETASMCVLRVCACETRVVRRGVGDHAHARCQWDHRLLP